MGNMVVFILVILAGIYGVYTIYRQIKHGKCSCCEFKSSCSTEKKAGCKGEKDNLQTK